jgi:transcriptional regulator with XRE-family HTH domain
MLDFKKHFGEKVKEKREQLGLRQDDISSILKLSRTSVINIESGRHQTTIKNIYLLACLFQCPVSEFFPPIQKGELTTKSTVKKVLKSKTVRKVSFNGVKL